MAHKEASEVEYKALSGATCEMLWIIYLLKDFKTKNTKARFSYYDNHSALHIAANSVFHERTKNLEIDCDFIIVVNRGRA